MAVFDELVDGEYMEEPEDRQSENLGRSNKKLNRRSGSVRKTSVSASSFVTQMRILKVVLSLAAILLVGYVAYQGIMLFMS